MINNVRLSEITELKYGAHSSFKEGACLMEAVAYVAGKKHSDHPECTCPILAAYGRSLNDRMPSEVRTELLLPIVPMLIGTKSTKDIEQKRFFLLADRAIRVFAPKALRIAGLEKEAKELEALQPISSKETSAAAVAAARAADAAVAAARAAARAARAAARAARAVAAARAARAARAAAVADADAADAVATRAAVAVAVADAVAAARAADAAVASKEIWQLAVQAMIDAIEIK